MANYNAVDMEWLGGELGECTDILRTKTGGSADIAFPEEFKSLLNGITPVINGVSPTTITNNGTYSTGNYSQIKVDVPIPEGYIKPAGTKSITKNDTYDVTDFASAVVDVPIPDNYINLNDVTLHITKWTGATFLDYASTGKAMNTVSIAVGFKPKIFLFLYRNALNNSTATQKIVFSVMLCDDNYEMIQQRTVWMRRQNTSSSTATAGQTTGTGFVPTENGVQGEGTILTADSGGSYAWMAWG